MKLLSDFLDLLGWLNTPRRICKTRKIDDRFFECKVKKPNPDYCEYALRSGGGFICNHQSRAMFTQK